MGAFSRKPRVNKTLISLKIVAFFVLSGISALHILNNRMPSVLGLNFNEYRNITIIATFVSILGPLIVGPLADRFAAKSPNSYGKFLRILTAVFLLITAIIYACLFAVPEVKRGEPHQPLVSFGCDSSGAVIFQQRCSEDNQCHHWKSKVGSINLTRCTYTCQDPTQYENMYTPWLESIPTPSPSTEHSSEFDYEDESIATATESLKSRRSVAQLREQSSELGAAEVISSEVVAPRQKRAFKSAPQKVYVEPPHLCMTSQTEAGETFVKHCHVYTDDTTSILVHTVMKAATNLENDTHSAEWCNYPLDGFQCQIPLQQANYMIQLKNNSDCKPMIECQVIDPYGSKGSVLADSECVKIEGDLEATLAGYTTIRILGDIFALACLTLLNTAIVIAVRETSEGRGEVCRQYAWGAVGYVVLFCSLDLFFFTEGPEGMTVALILVIICFIIGALVLLFASQMPLSPPEWWWHTKTGMLVYPMSAIRKYSPEIFVLTLVALLFGTFWGSIHSYLYWSYLGEYAAYFAGLLLILVLFLNVDKFIEYCGHSNIFIGGFAMFIIRFTALASKDTDWLTNLMEIIEPVIVGIVWITIILYMRHVMPRKFTATGQASAVIAFFALGKGFGALIGLVHDDKKGIHNEEDLIKFEWLSVVACTIALIYFVIYNLILAPRCAAKPVHLDDLMSGSASQTFANGTGGTGNGSSGAAATNGNGTGGNGNANSYSPLRVYHNERGKKGQFRY